MAIFSEYMAQSLLKSRMESVKCHCDEGIQVPTKRGQGLLKVGAEFDNRSGMKYTPRNKELPRWALISRDECRLLFHFRGMLVERPPTDVSYRRQI